MLTVAVCLSAGCRGAGTDVEKARFEGFKEVYAALAEARTPDGGGVGEMRYDAKFDGITLRQLSEYLAVATGKTIVVENAHLDKTVVLDVKQETLEIIIHLAARQAGSGVVVLGSAYIIGEVKPEDYGVMVRRVPGLNRDDLGTLLTAVGTGQGRVYAGADGLAVVADSIYSLMRMNEAFDRIMDTAAATWVVQLYFLADGDHRDRELSAGLEFEAGYRFADASASGRRDRLEYAFDSWLRAKGSSGKAVMRQSPMILTSEGSRAVMHSGRNIPVPKKTVSDGGTVSTTDYDMVKDGLDLDLLVRDGGQGAGVLELRLSVGQVDGFVGDAPITAERRLETTVRVNGGGVYLLGLLEGMSDIRERGGFLSAGGRTKAETTRIEVWARVYRIGGPIPTR